ncbi:MAG: hypothetical protein IJ587_11780 [Synergistaceae bacterium]|nr:hypothetical protein [Synergistaceae bacterium]MBR1439202.1 hypothetical protein [Synergistaceae bacterium]
MSVIIFPPANYDTGSGSSGEGHTHSNSATLNKLSTDTNGNLCFNGKTVGEKAIETALNITLTASHIAKKAVELPDDCDTSRIVTLSLNGVSMPQGDSWSVSENVNNTNTDFISWNGLSLENIAQVGDKVLISYYKKL